jgi:hypothetical protein
MEELAMLGHLKRSPAQATSMICAAPPAIRYGSKRVKFGCPADAVNPPSTTRQWPLT